MEDLWSDLERYEPTVEEHRHAALELAHHMAVVEHSSSSSSTISVCFEEDSLDLREEARWYEAMIEEIDDEDVGGRYVYR